MHEESKELLSGELQKFFRMEDDSYSVLVTTYKDGSVYVGSLATIPVLSRKMILIALWKAYWKIALMPFRNFCNFCTATVHVCMDRITGRRRY